MHNFWANPRSLVATSGISVDFFSSRYGDISVPWVRFPTLYIQVGIPLARWVSPFGHRGINACCQLLRAFRRLPRPSSPLTATASTVDAYSLDHITRRHLRIDQHSIFRLIASTTHLNSVRVQTLVTSQVVKEPRRTSTFRGKNSFSVQAFRSDIKLDALSIMVGLGGLEPPTSPLSGVRSNHLSYRPNV